MNDDIVNILKITHIINVTLHVENAFENKGVKYLKVGVDDSPKYKVSGHFKKTFDFIENALTSNGKNNAHNNEYAYYFNQEEYRR